ncbi:hypothetical protein ACVIN2_002972 [Bradyrhizobium sp. USDA 3650]
MPWPAIFIRYRPRGCPRARTDEETAAHVQARQIETADRPGLARRENGLDALLLRDDRIYGQSAGPAQIFEEGVSNQRLQRDRR